MGRKSVPWALRPLKKHTLYLTLLYCSYSVSTILNPSSASGTKNSNLSLLLPANVSTLDAPATPSGFEVDINYHTSTVLSPLAVYTCAIGCMYQIAQLGWYKPLVANTNYTVGGYNVQIGIESTQAGHGAIPLATRHMVIGLYTTMLDVTALSRFCEVHQRLIGLLFIEKTPAPTLEQAGMNATNLLLDTGSLQTYPSGRIVDPNDRDFEIEYTYSGARLNSKDVFLGVLDALATAAQFGRLTFFESLNAVSPSCACTISIVAIQSSTFRVTYNFVTKALLFMITDVMIYLKKFGEVTLQLEFKGSAMAEISVKSADHRPIAQ